MSEGKGKTRSLTVLLLKGDASEAADFIKPEKIGVGLGHFQLEISEGITGELFVRSTQPRPPRWATFFSDHILPSELGLVSSSAGALVLQVDGSWFALTFGYGLYLLRAERIAEGFGLRCTLNAVDAEALRSIDKETFDAVASQSRLQASRGAAPGEFGIDVERDLLKAVTGKPKDAALGQRLSGKDALAITTEVRLDGVPELLMRLTKLFAEDTYRNSFQWVDDVRRVVDDTVTEELDTVLFKAIASGDHTNSWLAPPDVLEWADVRFFSYSDSRGARVYTDIHWRTLLRNIQSTLSREALKRRKVYCYGDDESPLRHWSVYSCIYAQIDLEGGTYLLTGGNWYRVAADFVEEVEAWFQRFPKSAGTLPMYKHETEAQYNAFVSASSNGHYALLDKKNVRYGRGRSLIEFCDLLGLDNEIVHVKRYLGSSGLSHLFAQGLVSGELLRVDRDFRKALRRVVPAEHFEACELSKGSAARRRVTFGIIYRSRGGFVLPFFSMISLRRAAQRLQGFGYRVQISRIEMDEAVARLEKPKSQAL